VSSTGLSKQGHFTLGAGAFVATALCCRREPMPMRGVEPLQQARTDIMGKGCILWLVGIPIPIIILLYLFNIL
jgi:hypothetical protein